MLRCFSTTMNKEEIFAAWSPEASLWSDWVKPVLFAHLDSVISDSPVNDAAGAVMWSPPIVSRDMALVLDLPGPEGVMVGVSLAGQGYRPVPLYNAVPIPFGELLIDPITGREMAAVNILPIIGALKKGAEQLAQANLPSDAPPAFLLDANRRGGGRQMQPDEFDNRSICFTTDFPSANLLWAHGIRRALLVQRNTLEPQPDLAHLLRRWQEGGLALERMRIDSPASPQPLEIARPSWYGAMFQRALAAAGFRRAEDAGFGAWMPESSAGS
jgi:hypothetical protein